MSNPDEIDQPDQDPSDPDATGDEATGAGGTSDAGETRTAQRTGSSDAADPMQRGGR